MLRPSRAGVGAVLLGAAEDAGPETGLVFVALAAVVTRDTPHHLVDVLAATSPGHLAAFTAYNGTAHCVVWSFFELGVRWCSAPVVRPAS